MAMERARSAASHEAGKTQDVLSGIAVSQYLDTARAKSDGSAPKVE